MPLPALALRTLLLAVLVPAAALVWPSAAAAQFVLTDADFQDGVYELRYYPRSNALVQNGVGTTPADPFATLFLTNAGNVTSAWVEDFSDPITKFLRAPGICAGFGCGANSSFNTLAAATMGWDLSAVTGQVASVELVANHFLFQFPPWHDEALGDKIFGDVATPAAFGAGPYTNLYTFESNNPTGTGPGNIGLPFAVVQDLTASIPPAWLDSPGLLELRFGYELANTDIPGRHLQLFRDFSGTFPDDHGFMLRITLLVPECGNGVIEGGEECDDGVDNSDATPDACRTDCTLPVCGDGVTDTGEECDGGPGCLATCQLDSDGDGVLDSAPDLCPGTAPGAVVNAAGCSIAQLAPCEGGWKNHGQYVQAVAHAAEAFLAVGLITEADKEALVSAAAQSTCGK